MTNTTFSRPSRPSQPASASDVWVKAGARVRREMAMASGGGISQAQLADAAGLDPVTVSRILSGRQRPNKAHIVGIARALHLEPATVATWWRFTLCATCGHLHTGETA